LTQSGNRPDCKYTALQDEDIARRSSVLDIIRALGALATRTFGDKTDGRLPQTYVGMTPEIAAVLGQLLHAPAEPVGPAAPMP
jgi:hypothetical protein